VSKQKKEKTAYIELPASMRTKTVDLSLGHILMPPLPTLLMEKSFVDRKCCVGTIQEVDVLRARVQELEYLNQMLSRRNEHLEVEYDLLFEQTHGEKRNFISSIGQAIQYKFNRS
jgi:hypothetical protein